MYFAVVLLLTIFLPIASAVAEFFLHHADPLFSFGKWMVFWACGVRLFLAGLRQTVKPRFTAEQIFEIKTDAVLPVVRELGFSNLSMGLLGLSSLVFPALLWGAGLVGGTYYALAGFRHLADGEHNAERTLALVTDLFVAASVFIFLTHTRFAWL